MSEGFSVFTNTVVTKYSITGPDCQILSISLSPNDEVTCEPGSMMFMSPNIHADVEMGSCSRMLTGETLCKAKFTNTDQQNDGFISFTPNFPAKVVPVNLQNVNGKFVTKSGGYMASIGKVSVVADFDCCSFNCCCGGMGMIRQTQIGSGTVFLAAGGTILEKTLAAGEIIVVDTNSVVGFADTVTMSQKVNKGCLTCCCGGEGLTNTQMTGPGLVILQSMSFEKYKAVMVAPSVDDAMKDNAAPV